MIKLRNKWTRIKYFRSKIQSTLIWIIHKLSWNSLKLINHYLAKPLISLIVIENHRKRSLLFLSMDCLLAWFLEIINFQPKLFTYSKMLNQLSCIGHPLTKKLKQLNLSWNMSPNLSHSLSEMEPTMSIWFNLLQLEWESWAKKAIRLQHFVITLFHLSRAYVV